MTLARVRRPTCEARSAAWKASPSTYTPPWKYRTTWRGSSPSIVISAVGTPPSAAAVTVTSAGSGCADSNSRSSRRCSLMSLPTGKADCRRTASRFSRCSVLTEDLPSTGVGWAAHPGELVHVNPLLEFSCWEAGHYQACRQAGEEASPDPGDSLSGTSIRKCGIMPDGRGLPWLVRLLPRHVPGTGCPSGPAARAEQGSGDDGAAGEDAGGAPERGVVAVGQRQPGQGVAADEPGRGEMRGEVGGDGAGEDGVQQRCADRAAEHLADGDGRGGDSRVLRGHAEGAGVDRRRDYHAHADSGQDDRAKHACSITRL